MKEEVEIMFVGKVKIRAHEQGLLFKDKEFKKLLGAGRHWCFDPFGKTRVDVVSMRDPWLVHDDLDLVVAANALTDKAQVVELSDHQRGLVWIEKRFATVLAPGQYVLWDGIKDVRIEFVDATDVRFVHSELRTILESECAGRELISFLVDEGKVGMFFLDGVLKEVLPAGHHVFWQRMGQVKVLHVDLRECVLDVGGQEIMTRDKVSLRLNGITAFRVIDPEKAVTSVENYEQALYRETQLALRAVVGTAELDQLLADKDSFANQVRDMLLVRAADFGLKIMGFGIRDIILPGEMKELLNKVVESKKAAEANLITRREETAAMRSQANTARILADNPTLMRLRELEVLEKVANSSNLNVVCGEGGLADKVMKLI